MQTLSVSLEGNRMMEAKKVEITRRNQNGTGDVIATYTQELLVEGDSPLAVGQCLPVFIDPADNDGREYLLDKRRKNWGVYHIPSGLTAGFAGMTKAKAIELRGKLLQIEGIDWTRRNPLEGIDKEIRQTTGELCRSYVE